MDGIGVQVQLHNVWHCYFRPEMNQPHIPMRRLTNILTIIKQQSCKSST
jgi:hypothetical protein